MTIHNLRRLLPIIGLGLAIATASFILTRDIIVAVVAVMLIWASVAVLAIPKLLAPALLGSALLFLRPNLLGETNNVVGLVLIAVSAVYVSLTSGAPLLPSRIRMISLVLVILVVLSYFWMLIVAGSTGNLNHGPLITGMLSMMLALVSTAIICSTNTGTQLFLRVFVALTVFCSASYMLTLFIWLVVGVHASSYFTLLGVGYGQEVSVHFPFTLTMSNSQVFGQTVPRFLGYAREPGWMAVWCGASALLYKYTGWRSRVPWILLLVGTIGTISTAGFSLLVMALAVNFALSGTKRGWYQYFRLTLGSIFIALATWLAFNAPIVGILNKEEQNSQSLSERADATAAGLRALITNPFSGGQGSEVVSSINLIAGIAVHGLPWALLLFFAVLCPLFTRARRTEMMPFVGFVALTLVTSQPSRDSILVFIIVILASTASTASLDGLVPRTKHWPSLVRPRGANPLFQHRSKSVVDMS